MKNLPDKIWINPSIDLPKLNGIIDKNSVQYTITDAFIEKACEWLYLQLNEINMEGEDMKNFLKDFKNYMKGE